MINFILKWPRGDNWRWAGLILQNTQDSSGLYWVMVKEGHKQVQCYSHDSLWIRKVFFMRSLKFNSLLFCVVSMWEKRGSLKFHLCDLQGQSFQDMFNRISFVALNTMFIIKYAPEFIVFCQAIGQ